MGMLVLIGLVVLLIWWWNKDPPPSVQGPSPLQPEAYPEPYDDPSPSKRLAPMAPDAEQSINTAEDIPRCSVESGEDECAVCQSMRTARFVTPRIRLCQWCVRGLNDHAPLDVVALARVVEGYRHPDEDPIWYWEAVLAGARRDRTISRAAKQFGLQPDGAAATFWRKVLRAYQLGLVSGGAAHARLSDQAWHDLARSIRREDGRRCAICGVRNVELQVHHIVHLQHYGTNAHANLVTLCHPCHLQQHPGHLFSRDPSSLADEAE